MNRIGTAEVVSEAGVRLDGAHGLPAPHAISEKEFMALIVREAKAKGWKVMHHFDSRKSEKGWPDLFMVRGNRAIALECKTDTGKPTQDQLDWIVALGRTGIAADIVRPCHWDRILKALA
jgi:hypothetical protein